MMKKRVAKTQFQKTRPGSSQILTSLARLNLVVIPWHVVIVARPHHGLKFFFSQIIFDLGGIGVYTSTTVAYYVTFCLVYLEH